MFHDVEGCRNGSAKTYGQGSMHADIIPSKAGDDIDVMQQYSNSLLAPKLMYQ